ncbi:hypothetical protein PGT21_016494 [Puccinia graminis f. sp. tritici]|uniref:Uncharacterized protein n=1 Tax=Puccinia graminis f. sp. tritici TaxID=56615 RepID=A0A5B0QUV7_PUCGR|nr:hypothetical protein PGT21_016494 [Puccinia graminis f. sp. tritici]
MEHLLAAIYHLSNVLISIRLRDDVPNSSRMLETTMTRHKFSLRLQGLTEFNLRAII